MKNPEDIVLIMKILSNSDRLRILHLLLTAKREVCVNEIADFIKRSPSLTSHQLAYLSARGLVFGERKGQTTCYAPAQTLLAKRVFDVVKFLS